MHNSSGYIIIEGNIGVGKSTFAQILTEAFTRAGSHVEYLQDVLTRHGPVPTLDWNEPRTRDDLQAEADLIVKRLTHTASQKRFGFLRGTA